MDRDEFERLKAAEKEHLRQVRALKQRLTDAQRQQRLGEAIRALDTEALGSAFDEALREVQREAAESEARLDVALDGAEARERAEHQRLEAERFEDERRKAAAADLVRQMKQALGGEPPAPSAPPRVGDDAPPDAADRAEPPDDRPGKTLGRPRRSG